MKYIIQKTDMTFCPGCQKNVSLLCSDDFSKPPVASFYICFDCKRVFQIGVGEVTEPESGK